MAIPGIGFAGLGHTGIGHTGFSQEISEIPAIPELLPRFCLRFSSFSEGTVRERVHSQREAPNLRFCWQARHFQGFADFAEKSEIHESHRKIATMQLRARAWRENHDIVTPKRGLASILVASARSRVLPDALSGLAGRLCRLSGCARSSPEAPSDAPETLPARSWVPRDVPRGSWH